MKRATLLVTVANEEIFERDAKASTHAEVAAGAVEIIPLRGYSSQAAALNDGIRFARTELIICPHQDVAFGAGWLETIERLAATTPGPWGVLGPAGTTHGNKMYGTHSGLGMDGYQHVTAQTLDGSCLILKKSSGMFFDEHLSRFHGYDVDICLEAAARHLGVFVINLPAEHHTRWASTAGQGAQDFHEALRYVARKWHDRGVGAIYTTFGTF